ncbi:MAG: alpha-amylase family glycosyl hydrolase [Henriciella sp.]|nr:alpha-amylase family glycosyl hydrolase [Henriciella sp.]
MCILRTAFKSILASSIIAAATACISVGQSLEGPTSDTNPRAIEDEIIYFVLPDRFENGNPGNDRAFSEGGPLEHGYDPTHKGFYHGGDMQGLTQRLDYVQGMGATAIWLTPIFANRWVQGGPGQESAGYHGYWITDFLNVDPHLGTREDFKALVEAAHARGMKVYMDIITNHTADVIMYRECHDPNWTGEKIERCSYRYIGDYPWTTRGSIDGEPINSGFLGDDAVHQKEENFAKLKDLGWAYTPYVMDAFKDVKNPAWLNDMIYYHNRGDTDFIDEDSLYGDFVGLDDLNTAHPRVVEGMIEIYKSWITDFRVDGFRIDTARHVRDEFWQAFTPAIMEHAESLGIDHFHVFGEVYVDGQNPQHLAKFTTRAGLPTVLDFAFQSTARDVVINGAPGLELDKLYSADAIYKNGEETTRQLPTFLGNHDMGRFAGFLRASSPEMSDAEMVARTRLAHGLMMMARGVPTIYYGDEQGFVSDGNDQDARENMFPSQTAVYNDNDLIGTDATTAESNFDTTHPIYAALAEFSALRQAEPAIRRGTQITRLAHRDDSVFVFSRIDYETGTEIVVAINAEAEAKTVNVAVDGRASEFSSLLGTCKRAVNAPSSYQLNVPALDLVVCKSVFEDEL